MNYILYSGNPGNEYVTTRYAGYISPWLVVNDISRPQAICRNYNGAQLQLIIVSSEAWNKHFAFVVLDTRRYMQHIHYSPTGYTHKNSPRLASYWLQYLYILSITQIMKYMKKSIIVDIERCSVNEADGYRKVFNSFLEMSRISKHGLLSMSCRTLVTIHPKLKGNITAPVLLPSSSFACMP